MIRDSFHIADAHAAAWVNSEEGRALLARSARAARAAIVDYGISWTPTPGKIYLRRADGAIEPCSTPLPPAQLDLVGAVEQYRRRTSESPAVHAAVVKLRRNRYRVEPRGRWAHLVDGKQMTHEELIRLADTLSDRRESA